MKWDLGIILAASIYLAGNIQRSMEAPELLWLIGIAFNGMVIGIFIMSVADRLDRRKK